MARFAALPYLKFGSSVFVRGSNVGHRKSQIALAVSAALAASAVAHAQGQLEEVIVTAQKREESLGDIGIAINVISGETLRELNLTSTEDIARFTPGFTATDAGGAGIPVYSIRGIGFDDFSTNSNSTVGVYRDEVNLPYPVMTRGLQFDQSRVEVLKGPQGDLYGRNNTGGAVNFVSNKPTGDFESGIMLGYGSYDTVNAEGMLNGALSDSFNARLSFGYENRADGWQTHEVTGEKNGELERSGVRLMLDWAITDSASVLLNVNAGREDGEPLVPQSTLVIPGTEAYVAYLYSIGYFPVDSLEPFMVQDRSNPKNARWTAPQSWDGENSGASAIINVDFANTTLTSITAYQQYERDSYIDWDGIELGTIDTASSTDIDVLSQELRLASDGDGQVSWIAGIYLSSDEVEETNTYNGLESPTIGFDFSSQMKQETDTRAVFGHMEWSLTDTVSVTFGARYTEEDREVENCTLDTGSGLVSYFLGTLFPYLGFYNVQGPVPGPGECAHLNMVTPPSATSVATVQFPGLHSDELNTDKFTGKAALNLYPNDDWLIYGSIASSFKSGGFSGFSALVDVQFDPYQEEELTAYEIGFKGDLAGGAARLNGAVFYYDYTDKQINDVIEDPLGIFPGLVGLRNVPESRVTGAELELQWAPTDRLMLMAAGTWLDTEVSKDFTVFDGFNQVNFNANGLELPNAPEWSHTFVGTYEIPLNSDLLIRTTIDWMHQGDTKSFLSEEPAFRNESYDLIGARISLADADDTWSISAWGRNLSDENYRFSTSLAQDNVVQFAGIPRTYGVTFRYSWR